MFVWSYQPWDRCTARSPGLETGLQLTCKHHPASTVQLCRLLFCTLTQVERKRGQGPNAPKPQITQPFVQKPHTTLLVGNQNRTES